MDDRAAWLIEALSAFTPKAALEHLAQGWLDFTKAQAVFICRITPQQCSGVFLRANGNSEYLSELQMSGTNFGQLDGSASMTETLAQIETDLADESLKQPPVILQDDEDTLLGFVQLWADKKLDTENCGWLEGATLRLLANLLGFEQRLLREKLESLGEFAAGAGHEINNPVATIAGRARNLLQSETDPERRRQLRTIGGQALRIRDMIGDVMLFARPPQPKPEPLNLAQALPKILRPLKEDLETAGADLACDAAESVPIFADRVQLAVVVTELVRNSIDWLKENGKISLKTETLETAKGKMARIVIQDNGESFSEELLPHVFDPFFSGRQAGRGLGFGLPKCWRIVSNHHGKIEIQSLGEEGTRVTVTWPAYDFRKP